MKVLDLLCTAGHGFEGWFASLDDFEQQRQRGLIDCPLCGSHDVSRRPSAPRLNLSGVRADDAAAPAQASDHAGGQVPAHAPSSDPDARMAALHAAWLQAVRHVVAHTEDVGARFSEEARRIHYGESASRGIRGQASEAERESLREEGIEVATLLLPPALKGTLQ